MKEFIDVVTDSTTPKVYTTTLNLELLNNETTLAEDRLQEIVSIVSFIYRICVHCA